MNEPNFMVNREELSYVSILVFDAPCELVWEVYTDPALVPKWWGPKRLTTLVDRMEVRVGGAWRYILKDDTGNEYAFNGVYQEVDAPRRLVSTFEFEGMAGHIATDTITFEALPGERTKVTARSTVDSLEALEALVQPGMEEGALQTWERFGELVVAIHRGQLHQGL